ncbi:hypothetical protein EHV15_23160 [Paenibacillus oralis]|uniref:DUF1795 domain-containing protein n=1 Tax=Paenibacillus oralis TaxID=2490856 RepID=A0A3P3UAM9_9BACL|nr:hypothetical protein [Paenibacillus oralis]RRJ65493.1 hypothetical protein EHV15_23160 [Paenibacillus oralis]
MEHWDLKIISAINERDRTEEPDESVMSDDDSSPQIRNGPDLNQPIIVINGERVPFGERAILQNQLIVTMPKTFHEMTPEMAALKYPSEHRPKLIFTNEHNTIDLSFNHTLDPIDPSEFEAFTEQMVQLIKRTQKIIEWIEQGIRELAGKKISYCEFVTPVADANMYNMLYFTELKGTLLIATFNCLNQEKEGWRAVAKSMLDSLKFAEEV